MSIFLANGIRVALLAVFMMILYVATHGPGPDDDDKDLFI